VKKKEVNLKILNEYLFGFITAERKQRFLDVIQHRTRYITVVIENLYQSHNTSAVIRTCDCFGVQDVHIIENKNKYNINDEIALGSSNWLNIQHYSQSDNNTQQCFETLKDKGYTIVATTPHKNDCLLEDLKTAKKIALVFGTEKDGLTETAIACSDEFVKIPMNGFTESFNISVSAGIFLHYLTDKIRHSNIKWQLTNEEKEEILFEWLKTSVKSSEALIEDFLNKH
jgi:tRNA (guanosine-2'-O-)-methyltransferase